MQAIREDSRLQSSPTLSSDPLNQSPQIADREINSKVKEIDPGGHRRDDSTPIEEEENGADYGDFTFSSFDGGASPVSADVVFQNGQIKPNYPLFDQSLLRGEDESKDGLSQRPSVKKIFVETEKSGELEEEAVGPYCAWRGKAVEAAPEACKKSNSTGFSKIWKFRDRVNRSSSDGKDAFVYLNGNSTTTTTSSKRDEKGEKKSDGSSEKNSNGGGDGGDKMRPKKGGKTVSAHEMHYVKNRAMREEDRRRSYLPYRPEVVGFFTSVHGGLSKNVHPY